MLVLSRLSDLQLVVYGLDSVDLTSDSLGFRPLGHRFDRATQRHDVILYVHIDASERSFRIGGQRGQNFRVNPRLIQGIADQFPTAGFLISTSTANLPLVKNAILMPPMTSPISPNSCVINESKETGMPTPLGKNSRSN